MINETDFLWPMAKHLIHEPGCHLIVYFRDPCTCGLEDAFRSAERLLLPFRHERPSAPTGQP